MSLANFTAIAAGFFCNGIALPSSHCRFGDGTVVRRALNCGCAGFACVIPFGTSYTLVTEFYNAGPDDYFMTGDDFDKHFVRSGGAGPGWMETGQSFGAWSPGWTRNRITPAPNATIGRRDEFPAHRTTPGYNTAVRVVGKKANPQ